MSMEVMEKILNSTPKKPLAVFRKPRNAKENKAKVDPKITVKAPKRLKPTKAEAERIGYLKKIQTLEKELKVTKDKLKDERKGTCKSGGKGKCKLKSKN